MMSAKLAMFLAQAPAGLRPQDVFATSLYTGNGSTQTITNGINLSGEGGLVWTMHRSTNSNLGHYLVDSLRGVGRGLQTNSTNAQFGNDPDQISAFNANGFSVGGGGYTNTSGQTFVNWTFRRAPKFFDVVTYTGNGGTQNIAHSLGVTPGMIAIKRVDSTGSWRVWHRGASSGNFLILNTTDAQSTSFADRVFGNNSTTVDPSASVFTVGLSGDVNASGGTYIAYLFAHDTDASGVVQCGSFTSDGSGAGSATLGWRPQFVLLKVSSSTSDWAILDTTRGLGSGNDKMLYPNLSNVENATSDLGDTSSTGFTMTGNLFGRPSSTHIYLAIREPI